MFSSWSVYPDDGSEPRCSENSHIAMMANQKSGIEISVNAMT
tara:strand:+ start:1568 stop:1693 length:126 start_codon:yes stop_codon:yes gene_type:complete